MFAAMAGPVGRARRAWDTAAVTRTDTAPGTGRLMRADTQQVLAHIGVPRGRW